MDARPDDDADAGDLPGAEHPPAAPPPARDERATTSDDPTDLQPPAGPAPGDDEVWASIVARLSDLDGAPGDGPQDAPPRGRTVRGTRSQDGAADAGAPRGSGEDPVPATARLEGRDWDGTSQYDDAEDVVDDLEHFVPRDPGPVLGGDPLLTLAWGAATTVPVILLVVVLAWRDAPTLLLQAAAGVFLVAVGILVWRMPQRREPTDGDGAVV